MTDKLKEIIEFHHSQIKRFKDIDKCQKAFHQGAVMAFSTCQRDLKLYVSQQVDTPDADMVPLCSVCNTRWSMCECELNKMIGG